MGRVDPGGHSSEGERGDSFRGPGKKGFLIKEGLRQRENEEYGEETGWGSDGREVKSLAGGGGWKGVTSGSRSLSWERTQESHALGGSTLESSYFQILLLEPSNLVSLCLSFFNFTPAIPLECPS